MELPNSTAAASPGPATSAPGSARFAPRDPDRARLEGRLEDLVVGMAGSGGDGVVSAGESLLTAAASEGYQAMMTKSFGSQIRGGESSCRVRLSCRRVLNPGGTLDVAVALNWEDFFRFGAELPLGGSTLVIHEEKAGPPPEVAATRSLSAGSVLAVPITEMAKKAAGTDKAKTSVVLGLLAGWLGLPPEALLRGLKKKFGAKGAGLFEANERALASGLEHARTHPLAVPRVLARPAAATPRLLCDGNDLCAAGAIFAGCEFFGGYPITPSTEVMQFLSRELWQQGGVVLQAEDEISGIGAALGASFAGKKAMTATSGPGMSLKTEILGLATIAELPLVVLNVQRGGPSTGIPTKPEQADLFQAAFSAHGDVLRPVLAPTSVADTFAVTVEAFNLAERYQTPVILLSDQEIAQRKETVDPVDTSRFTLEQRRVPEGAELEGYRRFAFTESGVSPVSHPGLPGGNYLGAGIEHTEHGDPTASGQMHERMNVKRFRKLEPLLKRQDLFQMVGSPTAPLGLVSWGSSAGVAREAVDLARVRGLDVKLLVPLLVYPVAEQVYREFFASVRAGLVVELSYQGQLYRIVRMFVDLPPGVRPFARSGANPFRPSEVVDQLERLAQGGGA
ncbi:MAG TPA: 2-oxoacid:acceptor oxidoreductase subunit alpha [Myxococcaceae bacterium]|nr:2-oxoacid:acceptor oxidoreductase subunit alpha [Myxococcaceae bacterium]